MKIIFFITLLLVSTSCGLLKKQSQLTNEITHETRIITKEIVVDTLLVKKDVFSDWINLELLKKIGQVTYRGDRTTTRIYYRNGNIGFQTESDSLFKLLLNRFESYRSDNQKRVVITKVEHKKNKFLFPFAIGVAISVLILICINYVRKKYLN